MYVSADELKQINVIQEMLLHPLTVNPVDEWLSQLIVRFSRLTGAVQSLFILYDLDSVIFHSDDLAPDALKVYKKTASVDQHRINLTVSEKLMHVLYQWRRSLGPHVVTRDDLEAQQPALVLDEFEFFNDVIVPAGMAYPVMMGVSGNQGIASLDIYGAPNDTAFQERAVFFLNQLLPAFVSGMNGHLTIAACKKTLFSVFDTLPEAFVVFDASGKCIYANPMYSNYEKDELDASLLRLAIKAFTRDRMKTLTGRKTGPDKLLSLPATKFETGMAAYRAESFYLPEETLGSQYFAIRLTRTITAVAPSVAAKLRLSPRECEVAGLLVEGHSNKEIAEKLFISVHTVRRHVEAILKKLNVKSRASVMSSLIREA